MKKLIALFLFLSQLCLASGRVSIENQYFLESKVLGPTLGLTVSEPLFLGLDYVSWTGGGLNLEKKWWMTSKHDIEIPISDFTISVGAAYRLNPKNESDVHVKVSYDIWN